LKLAVSGKGGTGYTLLSVSLTRVFAEFVHSALLLYSNLSKLNIVISTKIVLSAVYENLFNLISSTVIPEAKINL
jgi:MinD superfamily P-loop ATPase